LSGAGSGILAVNASTETWNGLAGDDNWSSGANWVSTFPPGYAGDSVVFSGSTRTSPNLDHDYNVAGLTFDSSASGFTLGSAGGNTLTLSGGVTNNSSSAQVINVPMVLNGTQSILDPNGVGNTLAGNISGSGGLTMDASGFGSLTLSGTNTYAGDTTIPSIFSTLYLGSSAALPNGAGKGNVNVTGTLNLNGNDAAMNGLSGPGYVDNTGGNPVALSLGSGDATSTFGGLIQNSGAALTLVKVGAGALTLSGGNTYSGGTTLSAGQITLGAGSTGVPVTSGPLGTGPLTLSGGTLQMNAQTLGNDLIVSAGTTNIIDNAAGNSTISGNLSGAGTVTLQNSGNVNMSVYGGDASQDWSGFTGTFRYITGSRVINFNPGGTVCDLSHAAFYMSGNISYSTLGIGSGQTLKLGSLSGPSGYMYVNSGGALEVGNLNTDTTFGGIIQGAGTVTKVGAGTLTLGGVNTYTNLTTVSNGTLVVSTTTSANGDYAVVDGATLGVSVIGGGSLKVSSLTFGNSGNTFIGLTSTVNPAITNTGALTLAGTVTVNVSGAVSVGQYPLIASASIGGTGGFVVGSLPYGSAAGIVTNGNTIVLNVTTGSPPTFEWTGVNNGNWDLAAANNWLSNGVSSVYSDGKDVKFDDSSSRTNVVVAANVAPSSVMVTNSTRNYTFAGSGGITGSASLTKSGNGRLTLANTNSYNGGTVINNGTLQLGDGVANNGVVAGNVADNGSLIFANPLDQTFSAVISGTGSVVKRAPGNLTLGLNNTYAGGTLLDNATVTLPNGAVQAFGTGTLTFSNATLYVKPGGGSSYNSANSDYIGNNVVVPAGTSSIIDNSQNSYGNLWVGGDGVQWTGSGTVTIQNSSSVAGAAVLWNGNTLANFHGTLNIGATGSGTMYVGIGYNSGNGGTGASVATFDASGAAFTLDNSGSTLCQVVDANCTSVKFGSLSASNSGTVLRGNSSSSPASLLIFEVGALNTSTTFAGKITDWGSAGTGLKKVGTGTLELSGANTYTGPTTVNGGVLKIDSACLAASSDVVIASPGVLNLNFSGNNTVNTLTVDGVQQAAGTYGATGSGAAHIDDVHFAGSGVLNVTTRPAAPTPEPINATYSAGVLQLSWSNSTWSLQMQTNSLATGLSTNWTTLIPANSGINSTNIVVDPTKPTVFYRLTYP
jgi:autotransporter-associated beta strand protein